MSSAPNVTGLAIGDLDGDGKPDLVSSERAPSELVVGMGQGDGAFVISPASVEGQGPIRIHSLTNDEIPDLLATNSETIQVFAGVGDGSFEQEPIEVTLGCTPSDLVLDTFDDDALLDVVTICPDMGAAFLAGKGSGSFGAPSFFAVGPRPGRVVAADLNADGIRDLVTSYRGQFPFLNVGVSILMGIGDGTFEERTEINIHRLSPTALATADLDGDGAVDVLVAGERLAVLRGNGDGTLQPAVFFASNGGAELIVEDLDGDCAPDSPAASCDCTATPAAATACWLSAVRAAVCAPRAAAGGCPTPLPTWSTGRCPRSRSASGC